MTALAQRSTIQQALQAEIALRAADRAEPLSTEQRRIWVLGTLSEGYSPTVVARYTVRSSLTPVEVQLRLGEQVARHEALRSLVVAVDGRPARLVLPVADAEMDVVDPAPADRDDVEACVREFAARPFTLDRGPLIRALLLVAPDRLHCELVLCGHAIVVDASSLDTVAAAILTGPQSFALDAARDLTSFLTAERQALHSPELTRRVAAWGRRLLEPAATEIPGSRPRPEVKGHRRELLIHRLPAAAAVGVDNLVAAWLTVLMRWQGDDAAVCGVRLPSDRARRGVVGPLDRIRPVRVAAGATTTVADLVGQVGAELDPTEVDVPYAHLLETCPPRRDLSRTPYFQTSVGVHDTRASTVRSAGRTVRRVPSGVTGTDLDLAITLWTQPDGDTLHVEFDMDVLDRRTVEDLAHALATVLAAPVDVPLRVLALMDGPAVRSALRAGEGAVTDDDHGSLVDLVAAAVRDHPDAVAVQFGRTELSYRELWTRSGRIAGALRRRGAGVGTRVAVWLDRSADIVTAMLAVLRAGAAYVPVDPGYLEHRTQFLLADSGASLVLSASGHHPPERSTVPVLLLDDVGPDDAVAAAALAAGGPAAADVAYLIYTSGSTGRPKGVAVEHRGVVNNVSWRQRSWPLRRDDRVLHNHPFSFDPSVWAVFWPLISGARVVVAAADTVNDTAALVELLRDGDVTVVGGVPSLLAGLVDHPAVGECTKVRLVLSGGEPLTDELVAALRTRWDAEIVNLYGPTEASIDATGHHVRPDGDRPVPIGTAVDNTAVQVLDPAMRPVPDGVPGEIVISGAGLARGYHRASALTAARFLPNAFGPGRMYRTGDIGRRLPSGGVQFLGRADHQVKIRGHRVELDEVRHVVTGLPGVADAAVFAVDAGSERARLAAAVVPIGGAGSRNVPGSVAADVTGALAELLPPHLVPSHILVLDALPRTETGKLDHTRLAEQVAVPAATGPVTAPRSELESSVATAFAQVLHLDEIDVHADFFELGGTSVLLSRLATLLSTHHDVHIPLHEFFRVPSVAAVTETIELYRAEGLATVLGRQHARTLEADGTLPESITPASLPRANWSDPRRVLLTGATGYLGLHLVEQLLRRTGAEVVCLVRADDEEHALARVREGLDLYEIDVADQWHRVRCVVGDLGQPRLGLDVRTWDELAAGLDVIYHNGAMVNFVSPYNTLREPNVVGTRRVLELACTTRLKAVHHVSTIDTLLATHTPRPFLEDDAPLHSAVGVPAGYTGSKWVAEKVVDVARRRSVPVTVFRPGLILGHTATGAAQTIDYLLVALRGFLPMRILPDYPRIFDIVPVDYVASALVHVSLRSQALGGFFHLFNPSPVPLRTFCDWIRDYGYEFDIVPFEEGRRRALSVPPGHPLYPLVPLIRDAEAQPHRALDPEHLDEVVPDQECARVLEQLRDSDIACPPTRREHAHAVLDYLVRIGFLPRPADVVLESPPESAEAGAVL